MEIALLVAAAENGAIGKDNALLWRLRDDLKLFKKRTLGHAVIMGRKTYESIGKPLPGRLNIVISRDPELEIPGCTVASSLPEAFQRAGETYPDQEIFVIGGGKIYELAAPYATKLYLTRVHAAPEADTFFDASPYSHWRETERILLPASEHNEFSAEVLTLVKP